MIREKLTFILISLLIPATCLASDEIDCSADCSGGKEKVSFADGNNVYCSCVDAGSPMEPTVPDPEVQEGVNNGDDCCTG